MAMLKFPHLTAVPIPEKLLRLMKTRYVYSSPLPFFLRTRMSSTIWIIGTNIYLCAYVFIHLFIWDQLTFSTSKKVKQVLHFTLE